MRKAVPLCICGNLLPRRVAQVLCGLCVLCGSLFGLDRKAFTFTSYQLELRVDPAGQAMTARGTITLRNDSNTPQSNAALQISSSLDWRMIESGGKPLQYLAQDYTTDTDHTGKVREAIITLPAPLAPHESIALEVGYAGTVPQDATRFSRIGLAPEVSSSTDWDRISANFTALRGAGYVSWYPVSMEAASISSGELFTTLADWRSREAGATLQARICWITDEEERLTVAANGQLTSMGSASSETNTGCSEYRFTLGRTVPTFVIGNFEVLTRPAVTVYYLKAEAAAAQEYVLAAEKALPFVEQWFGKEREKVQIIALNDPAAVAFESGPVLFMPLRVPATEKGAPDRNTLELALVHQLVHACFSSPREWMYEGLAHFGQALYREHQDGRAAALAFMKSSLVPLVTIENAVMHQTAAPQPLPIAADEVYFRSKAMYVWWMLRDMIGDVPLQRVLAAYKPGQDKEPSYIQRLVHAQYAHDLEWFFDDWVYRDRGLPDFKIDSAFPRSLLNGSYVVTITVNDLGGAGAEVPVIVRAAGGEVPKRVVVPAKNKAVVRIEVPDRPTEVVVNDGSVPESSYGNNSLNLTRTPAGPK